MSSYVCDDDDDLDPDLDPALILNIFDNDDDNDGRPLLVFFLMLFRNTFFIENGIGLFVFLFLVDFFVFDFLISSPFVLLFEVLSCSMLPSSFVICLNRINLTTTGCLCFDPIFFNVMMLLDSFFLLEPISTVVCCSLLLFAVCWYYLLLLYFVVLVCKQRQKERTKFDE